MLQEFREEGKGEFLQARRQGDFYSRLILPSVFKCLTFIVCLVEVGKSNWCTQWHEFWERTIRSVHIDHWHNCVVFHYVSERFLTTIIPWKIYCYGKVSVLLLEWDINATLLLQNYYIHWNICDNKFSFNDGCFTWKYFTRQHSIKLSFSTNNQSA